MIPIECPKCGRKGKAPSDRLKTRLVCKACHAVFHFDTAGHMILGEPESAEPKHAKAQVEVASVIEEFDLAKTLDDIPKPVKYGVPAVLVAVLGYFAVLSLGEGTPAYFTQANSVIRALASNNRSRVVSFATTESAESAGKWFDLWHGELEKQQFGSSVGVTPNLLAGDPSKDSELTLMMILSKSGATDSTVSINLPMKQVGDSWLMEGNKGLSGAEAVIAAFKKSP